MTALRPPAMRQTIAALLMAVLTLAGVGRGLAAASDAPVSLPALFGVAMPICHSGGEAAPNRRDPSAPAHPDGCDRCALCAPVIVSGSPELPAVTPIAHAILRSAVVTWTARLSRGRSPRQSQGPPAA